MYRPRPFALDDASALHATIDSHPFASLISVGDAGPSAEHLPLLRQATTSDVLYGHIARANPLWQGGERDALAIFHGPQAYVSPGWYPEKRAHGRVVPTWNYLVVHAHGRLRFIEDRDWLMQCVDALTRRFEQGRERPWSLAEAPADYLDGLCRAIVGVELSVERLVGKHKASQNKPAATREAVRRGLRDDARGSADEVDLLSGALPR
ncbi:MULTISPECIES: FMN-binding negative transcriptional regulator [unclassified Modicisalibacter]|uniref:FMN-binding negative transcriptional regulator n=1 Tax=unclassified Modicisalibacter TaxID=2679913 RepID=UPI001CCD483F|nr:MULTISPECIES: FMN-binding negative transcriptional regulator [unclassified Modicisalibacter]MBZ9557865.1 FMN-binding negative transcriptional regulator [Modicisalibacter sp. R2A 31.J]MBZ9573469.1 FMN-binding negative transcriptional regulator [Modicisalibacter sp. MOD 31.J]